MNKINLNKFSNLLFYLGVIVAVVGYYRIYSIKASLPSGVCPINDNKGILFTGVFMLLASVIIGYIYELQCKKK